MGADNIPAEIFQAGETMVYATTSVFNRLQHKAGEIIADEQAGFIEHEAILLRKYSEREKETPSASTTSLSHLHRPRKPSIRYGMKPSGNYEEIQHLCQAGLCH